jgi:NitT/TauT family transport system substrate-binding protein
MCMRRIRELLIVALMCMTVVGCGKKPQGKVVLQLKWVYNAGFAGDLIAKEKGFWKEQGLDVEVRPGGVGIAPIKVVAVGDAQFGVATGDQLLLGAEEGVPVVAVALAYKDNPLSWVARSSSGMKSAKDFRGKKIGLTFIDDEPLFNAMMARVGLDAKTDLQLIPVKFDTSPFLRGEVDAFPVYRNTQAIEIEAELNKGGERTVVIGPTDEGIVSYSNLYFVTREFEKKYPNTVRAFVAGVLKGWAYTRAHPDEVAEIVARYDKETKPDIIKMQVQATNKLVQPSPADRIGEMTAAGWTSTEQILLQAKQLKKQLDVNAVFTNKYVQ